MNLPLHRSVLVIDVETTGFESTKNACVEVGAVLLDTQLEVAGEFCSLVQPWDGAEIVQDAMRVNGITQQMLAKAPSLQETVQKFHERFAAEPISPVIAGWNVWFDVGFLKDMYSRSRLAWTFGHRLFDVQSVFAFCSGLAGYSQEKAIGQVLGEKQVHRALADASHTARIFRRLSSLQLERLPQAEK
jgi:DNA polymerase III epsilon subunit-like protein